MSNCGLRECRKMLGVGKPDSFLYVAASRQRATYVRRQLLSGTNGLLGRLNVYTFNSLAETTLAETPTVFQELSLIQREALLALICRQRGSRLRVLTEIIEYEGTISHLLRAIMELRQVGLTPSKLEQVLGQIDGDLAEGAQRLADLNDIWQKYEAVEGVLRDTEDLFREGAAVIDSRDHSGKRYELLVVEGGLFTAGQIELLASLAKRSQRVLADFSMFASAPAANIWKDCILRLKEAVPSVRVISPGKIESPPQIRLVRFPRMEEEVQAIVGYLKQKMKSGMRPDEVQLVVPQSKPYRRLLAANAEEAGIPLQSSAANGKDSPLLRLLPLLIQAAGSWRREEIIQILKSPYVQLGQQADPDYLEQLALGHNLTGGREAWRQFCQSNSLVKLYQALSRLLEIPASDTVYGYCEKLTAALRLLGCERRIQKGVFAHRDYLVASRELRVLRAIERVLHELPVATEKIGLTGEISRRLFHHLLHKALSSLQVNAPELETGVRIAGMKETVPTDAAETVVLGFSSDLLPASGREDWILTAPIRQLLRQQGYPLRPLNWRGEEIWRVWQYLKSPRVLLSMPSTGEGGEEKRVSPYLQVLEEHFPVTETPPEEIAPSGIISVRQLWQRVLMGWQEGKAYLPDRGRAYVDTVKERAQTELARFSAAFGPEDGVLTDACRTKVRQILGDTFSPSQLGSYGLCPFLFYCQHVLRVGPLPEIRAELAPVDKGSLLHGILCRFYRKFKSFVTSENLPRAREVLNRVASDYLERNAQAERLEPGIWQLHEREIYRMLEGFLTEEARRGDAHEGSFTPKYLELAFGFGEGQLPDPAAIDTPLGPVRIRGKIDRIDVDEEGRYVVIDYKTSRAPGRRDFLQGTDVQIPVYIQVVPQLIGEQAVPVGGAYYVLRSGKLQGIWHKGEIKRLGIRKRSLAPEQWEEFFRTVNEKIGQFAAGISQADFRVSPQECPPYCSYRGVCRYDRLRIEGKNTSGEVDRDGA